MPLVTMPDGVLVEMPDELTPELGARLRAMVSGDKPEPSVGEKLKRGAKEMLGFAEAPLAMGSGIVASALGGWRGLLGGGAEGVQKTQEALTYQPRTEVGKTITKAAAAPFEMASEGWGQIGQALGGDAGEAIGKTVVPITATLAGYRPMVAGTTAAVDAARQAAARAGAQTQKGAVNLQLTALKPTSKEYLSGDALFAAEDMLKRGISPNMKGIAELEKRIDALNAEISGKIGSSTELIQKQAVLDRLNAVHDKFMLSVNPGADLASIGKTAVGFQEHPLLPGADIPVPLAQKMKQGTYRSLRDKYGELGTAEVEAQKALARGLKEDIAAKVPGLAELNAEESALLRTLSVMERRAFAELNKDPVSMAGAMRSPEMWAAITMNKSAAFKSLLARQMYKLGGAMKKMETTQPQNAPPVTGMLAIPAFVGGSGMLEAD